MRSCPFLINKDKKMAIKKYVELNIEEIKPLIVPILKRNQVKRASIFGSVASGIANELSDLDLLVEFSSVKSLFDLAALKIELEECLHRSVDVLTFASISPFIKERILTQQVRIL